MMTAPEQALEVHTIIEQLADRWRSADKQDDFSAGRRSGYVQAIALLLNTSYTAVLDALHEGKL